MMSTTIPPDTPSRKIHLGKYTNFRGLVLNVLAISEVLFCLGKETDSIFSKPGSFFSFLIFFYFSPVIERNRLELFAPKPRVKTAMDWRLRKFPLIKRMLKYSFRTEEINCVLLKHIKPGGKSFWFLATVLLSQDNHFQRFTLFLKYFLG